jgi:hypothetical protein
MHFERSGQLLQTLAAAMLIGHALLPWSKVGWRIAEVSWVGLALVMVFGLGGFNAIFALALIPLIILLILLRIRPIAFARYAGRDPAIKGFAARPPPGPCQVCSDRNSDFVAPVICISAIFFTYVYHGRIRNLCIQHARLYALPAAFISITVGTLGLPFGLIFGPISAAKNVVQGGERVSGAEAHDLRWKSILEGDPHGYLEAGALMAGVFLVSGLASLAVLLHFDRVVAGG